MMPIYKYDYDDFTFKLNIPIYWEQIYQGKPHNKLYDDYQTMLEQVKKVSKNKYIMDVGANHGIFSVPCSMLGYKVLGFEPVKENFANLEQAAIENDLLNFNMFNYALSNENGMKDIYVPECPDNASLSISAAIANMTHKEYRTERVISVRFDDWIKGHLGYTNIGLIKIDAQGAEYDILLGMEDFLKGATNIYIICEYEDHLLKMGHTYEQLDELLLLYGFNDMGKITGGDKLWFKE